MSDSAPDAEKEPIEGFAHSQGEPYDAPRLTFIGNVHELLAGGEGSQDDNPISPTHGA
jgi:hypothetical protein